MPNVGIVFNIGNIHVYISLHQGLVRWKAFRKEATRKILAGLLYEYGFYLNFISCYARLKRSLTSVLLRLCLEILRIQNPLSQITTMR